MSKLFIPSTELDFNIPWSEIVLFYKLLNLDLVGHLMKCLLKDFIHTKTKTKKN